MKQLLKRICYSVILVALLLQSYGTVEACGLNLSVPNYHFPHVDDKGVFSYWESIGRIDVGGGVYLPININFKANRQSASSTIGAPGFHLALTDAYVVQIDERTFRIYNPAGRYRTFRRDRKRPNILHSGGSWKGEIRGAVISVSSECGDRLVYQQGGIRQMRVNGRTFDFLRSNGRVTEIHEKGRLVLKIESDSINGDLLFEDLNNNRIVFEFNERPIITSIQGKNIILRKVRSLSKIETGKKIRNFDFSVDRKLIPSLAIEGGNFSWNPDNGIIESDGEWHYNIDSIFGKKSHAAIKRINKSGQEEFWCYDKANGRETIKTKEGVETITEWFVSGDLKGKIRKIATDIGNERQRIIQRFAYDEKANLIRIAQSDKNGVRNTYSAVYADGGLPVRKQFFGEGELIFNYDKEGELEMVNRGGQVVYQKKHDLDSRSVIEEFEGGVKRIRKDVGEGLRSEILFFSDGAKQEKVYNEKNEIIKVIEN